MVRVRVCKRCTTACHVPAPGLALHCFSFGAVPGSSPSCLPLSLLSAEGALGRAWSCFC